MKTCTTCGLTRSLSEFYDNLLYRDGKTYECRTCVSNRGRAHRYRSRYGITTKQYDDMLRFQGGGCSVCGARPRKHRLHVDHDHRTGQVRGLLCGRCNYLVSVFEPDQWLIRYRVEEYLKRAKEMEVA